MSVIVPRKHTPHRVAALSLYRSLLRALPSAAPHDTALLPLLRHRFKRNIRLQSPHLLRVAFGSAHHLLTLLRSPTVQKDVSAYLSRPAATALAAKLSLPPAPPNPRIPLFLSPDAALKVRPLPLSSLRPKTDGTTPYRRIPVLYSANRFPVLRLTKPQPANLSIYITILQSLRERRWNRIRAYEGLLEAAQGEDTWDALMGDKSPGKWVDAPTQAINEVYGYLKARDGRSIARARWYAEIVEREREEKEKDRKVVRAWRRKAARERKMSVEKEQAVP